MSTYTQLIASVPGLLDVSDCIKIVEVAKKYDQPDGKLNSRVPEYTPPQCSTKYHCSKVNTSWTQGFFPGLLWLLEERRRLAPETIDPRYPSEMLIHYGRRWQEGFEHMAAVAFNHDQGFRFQLSYGKDFELTGSEAAKDIVMTAADSLVARYDDEVGCVRSWDSMRKVGEPDIWRLDNMRDHFLVIIDNMASQMNLDLLYLASELSGDQSYGEIATKQAWKSIDSHVRSDYTTNHVVDFNRDGSINKVMTHQGYDDHSVWSRGQAWGMYGYAQCALRTGEPAFTKTCRGLTDKFLELLGEEGVPHWDFCAPRPCPYDASAGMIAARAMQMLDKLLRSTEPDAAEAYRKRAFKLVKNTLRLCKTGKAELDGETVSWGEGGWETILKHSTINGNRHSPRPIMDHGLVYADYYLIEFGNEALKESLRE